MTATTIDAETVEALREAVLEIRYRAAELD